MRYYEVNRFLCFVKGLRSKIIEKMVNCVASPHARVLFYGSVPRHMTRDCNCFDSLFCYIIFSFSFLAVENALFEMHVSILVRIWKKPTVLVPTKHICNIG